MVQIIGRVYRANTTPEQLRAVLELDFPKTATCWSQATDEIVDISRHAREVVGLDAYHAVPFGLIEDPAEFNAKGVVSVVEHFTRMNQQQRESFLQWLTNFMRKEV